MSLLQNPYVVGSAILTLVATAAWWWLRIRDRHIVRSAELTAQKLLDAARQEATALQREARVQGEEEALQYRKSAESDLAQRRQEVQDLEKRALEREGLINRQLDRLTTAESQLHHQEQSFQSRLLALEQKERELQTLLAKRREELQRVAHLEEAEARALLLKQIELDTLKDAKRLTRHILEEAQTHAEAKARHIISLAIQRYAADHVNDISSATLALPSEDIKGRIIGREGRNIRAFETATGVTVLIDDTPNAVVLSAFDPVRRIVARESMQRLITDGRIHPSRIEEVVAKVTQEMEETIYQAGEEAIQKAGLPPFHPEIIRFLGRLRFRHSYSQNVLDHSIEVAHITGLLAAELGLNVSLAKRAGLVHDIGKAVNHEMEGAHALVGAELLRRHGEPDEIVHAVASHHNEAPHFGPLGILVGAADAISASRPGARSENMTAYIKRVESLERIGNGMPGVLRCFAVQAGRELRILVQPEAVDDDQAHALARRVSKQIEEELQYPGQIRVTVVRETRCVEYAK